MIWNRGHQQHQGHVLNLDFSTGKLQTLLTLWHRKKERVERMWVKITQVYKNEMILPLILLTPSSHQTRTSPRRRTGVSTQQPADFSTSTKLLNQFHMVHLDLTTTPLCLCSLTLPVCLWHPRSHAPPRSHPTPLLTFCVRVCLISLALWYKILTKITHKYDQICQILRLFVLKIAFILKTNWIFSLFFERLPVQSTWSNRWSFRAARTHARLFAPGVNDTIG